MQAMSLDLVKEIVESPGSPNDRGDRTPPRAQPWSPFHTTRKEMEAKEKDGR